MKLKKFFFEFRKISHRSSFTYNIMTVSEAFFVSIVISKLIFNLDDEGTLWVIGVAVILAPVGILFAGGYKKIKAAFMKKHNLSENEF